MTVDFTIHEINGNVASCTAFDASGDTVIDDSETLEEDYANENDGYENGSSDNDVNENDGAETVAETDGEPSVSSDGEIIVIFSTRHLGMPHLFFSR